MLRSRFRIILLLIVTLSLGYELWSIPSFADGRVHFLSPKVHTAETSAESTSAVLKEHDSLPAAEIEEDEFAEPIRGVFITGWVAGARLNETLQYIQQHDLNTVVIDIKDNDGRLSFAMPGTVADALGANAGKMGSRQQAAQLINMLREHGVYVIGRLALFQDNFLPHKRPNWALRTETGELWRDNSGGYWLDPTHRGVLDYHTEIAIEAAKLGFDEIQFDYIRYPSQPVPGYNTNGRQARTETITRYTKLAKQRIQKAVDVRVSGAVYGISAISENDYYVGQDYVALSDVLDSISPMFYPSHYAAGDFGLDDPNAHPYTTLFASTAAALARTSENVWGKLRPWIQSFFGYEVRDVEEQIRAMRDLGVDSFLVWNPKGEYVSGVNYNTHNVERSFADSPFRAVLYPLMSPAAGLFVVDPHLKLPTYLGQTLAANSVDVYVESNRDSFVIEVRQQPSVTYDTRGDTAGNRLITMRRTRLNNKTVRANTEQEKEPLNVTNIVTDDDGVELTWRDGHYVWSLWAPTLSDAFHVKRSLASVPETLLGRRDAAEISES